MKLKNHLIVVLILTLCVIAGAQTEQAVEKARWFGRDTIVYAWANDIDAIVAKVQKTSLYDFYTAPELHEFMTGAKEKLQKRFDNTLKDVWQEMGIEEPPQQLPWPHGQIVFGLFLQSRTVMVPDWSKWHGPSDEEVELDMNSFRAPLLDEEDEFDLTEEDFMTDFDPDKLPKVEQTVPDFQMVAVIEMGESMAQARELFGQLIEKLSDKEEIILQRETIEGCEAFLLKDQPEDDPDFDVPMIAFSNDRIIVGSSLKYLTQVIRAMEEPAEDNVADNPHFRRIDRVFDASDVLVFADVPKIIRTLSQITPEDEREAMQTAMTQFGVDNLVGVGLTVQMPADQPQQMQYKMLAMLDGEPQGLFKILAPETRPLRLNRFMARDVAAWMSVNYNLAKLYNDITGLVWTMSNMDVATMLEGGLLKTGDPASGVAAVNLKNDIMGQLDAPVSVVMTIEKPLNIEKSQKGLVAIQVRDSQRLDQSLARIYKTFIAPDDDDAVQKVNGRSLYTLPLGNLLTAFAVADDNFVFGDTNQVRQTLRNLGRDDIESVSLSPMFQYARRFLPEQAGAYFYEDSRKGMELAWHALKEEILNHAANNSADADPDDDAKIELNLELTSNPVEQIINEFKDIAARSNLPDFQAIEKYFGPTVGYFSVTGDGFYFEISGLRPPKD